MMLTAVPGNDKLNSSCIARFLPRNSSYPFTRYHHKLSPVVTDELLQEALDVGWYANPCIVEQERNARSLGRYWPQRNIPSLLPLCPQLPVNSSTADSSIFVTGPRTFTRSEAGIAELRIAWQCKRANTDVADGKEEN